MGLSVHEIPATEYQRIGHKLIADRAFYEWSDDDFALHIGKAIEDATNEALREEGDEDELREALMRIRNICREHV